MQLEKVMPLRDGRFSALWAPRDIEGLLLLKQPALNLPGKKGWSWLVLDDYLPNNVQMIRGQVFATRREAVQAIEMALSL